MNNCFDDSDFDNIVWNAIQDSDCAADFRGYLGHGFTPTAHREEALDQLTRLNDAPDGGVSRLPNAVAEILRKAESGDPIAQFHAGKVFAVGLGTSADAVVSQDWYRRAMAQGDIRATVNLAIELWAKRDQGAIDESIRLLRPLAESGVFEAMQNLAYVYLIRDKTVAQDWLARAWHLGDAWSGRYLGELMLRDQLPGGAEAGMAWLREAAAKGDAEAAFDLGLHFDREGDHVQACKCYRDAAEKGDVEAAISFGRKLLSGEGIARDGAEGLKWLLPAALMGHARAQLTLGYAYSRGVGVLPNRKTARLWLERAANAGASKASHMLGDLLESDDPNEAFRHYLAAAERGIARAQAAVGLAYWRGDVVGKNDDHAFKWINLAALQGDPGSICLLGWAHACGVGTPINKQRSFECFSKAAEAGHPRAQREIGYQYLVGGYVARDIAEACSWLTQAADQGDPGAERIIGMMFLYGDGVEQDPGEASSWFLAAAEKGDADAQFLLGKLYLEGIGLSRNDIEARRWHMEAARQGHREALDAIRKRWPDVSDLECAFRWT